MINNCSRYENSAKITIFLKNKQQMAIKNNHLLQFEDFKDDFF